MVPWLVPSMADRLPPPNRFYCRAPPPLHILCTCRRPPINVFSSYKPLIYFANVAAYIKPKNSISQQEKEWWFQTTQVTVPQKIYLPQTKYLWW